VAGANVTIAEMNTGVGRSTTTNDSGNYGFPPLPPGVYEVTVKHPDSGKKRGAAWSWW